MTQAPAHLTMSPSQVSDHTVMSLMFSCFARYLRWRFAMFPLTFIQDASVRISQHSGSVLLARLPKAVEALQVAPNEGPETFLLILHVLSTVLTSIGPVVHSRPVNDGTLPHSFELSSILAQVVAIATNSVVSPLPRVGGPVWPVVDPEALLLAEVKLTLVACAAFPNLDPIAVLNVLQPLAADGDAPISMDIPAKALGDVSHPLANEHVTIRVLKLTLAFGEIVSPVADELCTVRPDLHADAMSRILLPLAAIHRTGPESVLDLVAIQHHLFHLELM
mmetsp:Transcript_48752/g.113833  ORF Transcript_48752/g.113833 Transcript_48752/m.113833 type:complete len:278 (-) Transcript_48752:202-1035(-)